MSQKKFEAWFTPDRIVMVDGTDLTKTPVQPNAVSEAQLQGVIEAFNNYQEEIEDAIRNVSEHIESLKELAKLATQAYANVKIALLKPVKELVADEAEYQNFKDNVDACTYFMGQYIEVLEQQNAALDQNVPVDKLPIQHPHFMDSAFVNKAIGVAAIALGALSTLLGALAVAVSVGLISTVVLAPVGLVGANAGAGMVSGGLFTLAFGGGFFAHGRNLAKKEAAALPAPTAELGRTG